MNLQQFEKLLSEHLPPYQVRRIIRIYLETAGEEVDWGKALHYGTPKQ